jgi:hypothetical protein
LQDVHLGHVAVRVDRDGDEDVGVLALGERGGGVDGVDVREDDRRRHVGRRGCGRRGRRSRGIRRRRRDGLLSASGALRRDGDHEEHGSEEAAAAHGQFVTFASVRVFAMRLQTLRPVYSARSATASVFVSI